MKTIKIFRTKKGLPALWEEGGGMSNTGDAQIIADPNGEAKQPIYIRRSGQLANSSHALFMVHVGDIIISSHHHRRDFTHEIFRISSFREEEAELELIAAYSCGQWDAGELGQKMEKEFSELVAGSTFFSAWVYAVLTAEFKATCYHCREPHYFAGRKENQ